MGAVPSLVIFLLTGKFHLILGLWSAKISVSLLFCYCCCDILSLESLSCLEIQSTTLVIFVSVKTYHGSKRILGES